jgi:hypothetical protein
MPRPTHSSRELRRLAAEFLDQVADEIDLLESERESLVTSLVRQWITYEGNASLILDGHEFSAVVSYSPLGKTKVSISRGVNWLRRLREDWNLDEETASDAIDQLNHGQSAEVTSSDGLPLRMWINPREQTGGIEPLTKEIPAWVAAKRLFKIAYDLLETSLGDEIDEEEREELACSVAKQWQEYHGHGSLFLDETRQAFLTLKENDDGTSVVGVQHRPVKLRPLLESLGCPESRVPELIARMNLGQRTELLGREGVPIVLWHDPQARRVRVLKKYPDPLAGVKNTGPPIFCPKCNAVLSPWTTGQREQECPQCGEVVASG